MSKEEGEYLYRAGGNDDNDSEEEENNFLTDRFTFDMVKSLGKEMVEPYFNRFSAVKIPTGTIERCMLYYKKYPEKFIEQNAEDNRGLYAKFGPKSNEGKGKWVALVDKKETKKEMIEVKTFENPLLKKSEDPKEVTKRASSKILTALPPNRTVLAVSF